MPVPKIEYLPARSSGQETLLPDVALEWYIPPAAKRAEITKQIGWHSSAEHSQTLLQSARASVKQRTNVCHASPGITMGVYAKAVTADKREAQNAIAALFMGV